MGQKYNIIKKNMKIMLKSKRVYFMLFIIPFILLLFFSFAYYSNLNQFNVKIGVVSNQKTALYEGYRDELLKNNFQVTEYKTQTECNFGIKNSDVNLCLLFPQNFEIQDGSSQIITVLIDDTKGDVVSIVENYLFNIIDNQDKKIKKNIIEKLLNSVNVIDKTNLELNTKIQNYKTDFNNLKSNFNSLKSNFNSLDKSNTDSKKNILDLKKDMKKLRFNGDYFENSTEHIREIKSITSDLDSEIKSLEGNKESADELIEDLETEIKNLSSSFSDIETSISAGIFGIEESFSDVTKKFDNSQSSISKIDDKINSIDSKITKLESENKNFEEKLNLIKSEITKNNIKSSNTILFPVKFEKKYFLKNNTSKINSLFVESLLFLIALLSLVMSSYLFFFEKKSPAYKRNLLSTTSNFSFMFANLFSGFIVTFVQISIFLVVYLLLILQNYMIFLNYNFFILIILSILYFVVLGGLIANISKNDVSKFLIIFFVMMFFLMFSGKFIPFEQISKEVLFFIQILNPYLIFENLFRRVIFFNENLFTTLWYNLLLIVINFISLYIIFSFVNAYVMKRRFYFFILRFSNFFKRNKRNKKNKENKSDKKNKKNKNNKNNKSEDEIISLKDKNNISDNLDNVSLSNDLDNQNEQINKIQKKSTKKKSKKDVVDSLELEQIKKIQ